MSNDSDSWSHPTTFRMEDLDLQDDDDSVEEVTPRVTTVDSSSVTSGLGPSIFSTPTSQLSGGDEGSQERGKTVVFGLVYVDEVNDLCCGAVGKSGNAFCCVRKEHCRVEAHKRSKCVVPESRLFIKAKRAGQARLEPNLPVGNIPNKDFLEDLLVETKATDTWIAYFTSANAAVHKRRRDDDGSPWEDDMGSPALADLERTRSNFNTPKKLRLGVLMTAGFKEPEVPLPELCEFKTAGKDLKTFWRKSLSNGQVFRVEATRFLEMGC